MVYPYAKRFVNNAKKLNSLEISTITPVKLYRLPHIQRAAVHYIPVVGKTLRALTKELEDPVPILEKFAKFIAEIHRKGVYFRSLHLGNVVVTENDEFALIDIADLKFFSRPLSERQQKRNIKHLLRPPEDNWILTPNLESILSSYHQHKTDLSNRP